MKKIIISVLLVLFPALCLAGPLQNKLKGVIEKKNVAAPPSGDSCTGTLVFSWHCENSDTVGNGTDNGNGCVISGGDTSVTRATQQCSGFASTTPNPPTGGESYYAECAGTNADYYGAAISNTNIDLTVTGTWCGSVYLLDQAQADGTLDSANLISDIGGVFKWIDASTVYQPFTSYGGENNLSLATNTIAVDTWTRVCFSWTNGGSEALSLSTKVGVNAWQTSTGQTDAAPANPATYYVIGALYTLPRGYYDNIKMYTDYQHAE